jgi:hypothetical protein
VELTPLVSFALVPVARLRLETAEAFVVDSSELELEEEDDDEDEFEEELSESLSEPSAPATGGFFNLIDAS